MNAHILQLDRIEFLTIKVSANEGEFPLGKPFPQLECSVDDFALLTRSDLFYPETDAADPRVFMLVYGVRVAREHQENDAIPPYEVEVEAAGYFRYTGDDEFTGADRFRAVRLSGYQILYGAIREMVSNLTARSRHGLWHLPARNFGSVAKARADQDEQRRQELITAAATLTVKPRRKVGGKTAAKRSTGTQRAKAAT